MFKIKVSDKLYSHCKSVLQDFNFGKRHTANGTKEQQLTGIIGQSAVMELFGLNWVDGKSGFDDGIDLIFNNKKIDVKTMGRKTDVRINYTNNFLKLQDYFSTELYIFCSYHKIKREVTVCGWIAKEDFKNKRKFFAKGTIRTRFDGTTFNTFSDLYEIDNVDLNNVNSIDELKSQLQRV